MLDLLIVGGGRMGAALAQGLLAVGIEPTAVGVVEISDSRREELEGLLPGVTILEQAAPASAAVLSVKPQHVADAAAALSAVGVHRVLSIAAGISTGAIEAAGGPELRVVRAMPNTPALVGAGAAAIAPGQRATPDDVAWATSILESVGSVVEVTESQLDAVTGLSGSGPAYVFLVAESLIEAGVLQGLSRPIAEALVGQTILGAGRLLMETDESAAELRAGVTSPGGTTAAGLRALEDRGTRAAFLDAVAAATERSRELGAS